MYLVGKFKICKAVKNGWKRGEIIIEIIESGKSFDIGAVTRNIFFTHDFAKAFWGEEVIREFPDELEISFIGDCSCCIELPAYLYHLQQMVLEKELLKYIKKFL